MSKSSVTDAISQKRVNLIKMKLSKRTSNCLQLVERIEGLEKQEKMRRMTEAEEFKQVETLNLPKDDTLSLDAESACQLLCEAIRELSSKLSNSEMLVNVMTAQEKEEEEYILKTLKSSYKANARTYHPDRNGSSEEAKAMFQLLARGFETLSDKKNRMMYVEVNSHKLFVSKYEESTLKQPEFESLRERRWISRQHNNGTKMLASGAPSRPAIPSVELIGEPVEGDYSHCHLLISWKEPAGWVTEYLLQISEEEEFMYKDYYQGNHRNHFVWNFFPVTNF